eukprot:4372173-Amphidinium_carterae.1
MPRWRGLVRVVCFDALLVRAPSGPLVVDPVGPIFTSFPVGVSSGLAEKAWRGNPASARLLHLLRCSAWQDPSQ